MSAIVEEANTQIDPGDEVRRLQDLVQKLEQQNQILRTKHTTSSTSPRETNDNVISTDPAYRLEKLVDDNVNNHGRTRHTNPDNVKARNSFTDDLDILDVNTIPEDEESWLYTSPKRPTQVHQSISPYKWVRQEFEHPSPEVETAKRSLIYKLDEVARVTRSPSLGALGSLSLSPAVTPTVTPTSEPSGDTFSNHEAPAIRKPLYGDGIDDILFRLSNRVDTATFTRPKKSLASKLQSSSSLGKPLSPRQPGSPRDGSPHRLSPREASPRRTSSPRRTASPRTTPEQDRNGNAASSESLDSLDGGGGGVGGSGGTEQQQVQQAAPHRLEDVVDVRVMARMQEESLRQSLNASPKKSFKGSRQILADPDSSHSSNRSSPGRFEGDMYQLHQRSNNSLASLSSHSNSPPDSPYSSQYLDQKPQVSEIHRRSLPNLTGGGRRSLAPALQSHPSDTSLPTSAQSRRAIGGGGGGAAGRGRGATGLRSPQTRPSGLSRPQPATAAGGGGGSGGTPTNRQGSAAAAGGVRRVSPSSSTQSPSSQRRGLGGIPRPNTGIPRPGASRLPAPRTPQKSGLQPPGRRSLQQPSRAMDDSWKDGCF